MDQLFVEAEFNKPFATVKIIYEEEEIYRNIMSKNELFITIRGLLSNLLIISEFDKIKEISLA